MSYDLSLRVWRGDASGGDLRDYTVKAEEGEVVLDALHRLQADQTGDLAVRWNCKAGKCGSCSAEVNGRPRLLCMTRLNLFDPSETITVTPLRTFPVVRDLVTDVSFNYEQAKKLPPFRPKPREADGTYRMAQEDVQRSQEFRKCIECFLCQDTCHVIRDHEENKESFAGPRMFIRYAELEMHPLDTNDRRRLAQDRAGLGMCNITKCCTEVCPEDIHITDNAIIPMKERAADAKYDPLVWLGSKILRRDGSEAGAVPGEGDADAAERAARTRLEQRPDDRTALESLEEALTHQGRFAEAAEVSRRTVGAAGRGRAARMEALSNHVWVLLCAVEAGQVPLADVEEEATSSLATAQELAGTGTVLASTHALASACRGHWADAEQEARESLSWQRSPREQSDDLVTLARVLGATGRHADAQASLGEARRRWPDNPRLPGAEAALAAAPAG
jgi:succinate dehydrogenase / fumarate reductase, iron-sulfur subunit